MIMMEDTASARDERQRNRDLRREEEARKEKKKQEDIAKKRQEQERIQLQRQEEERRAEMERTEVVRRRLQQSMLKDQGVLLSDTEDKVNVSTPNGPPSPQMPGESHFVYEEEDYNLTLSPSESEGEDETDPHGGLSKEVCERTRYVEEEKAKLQERLHQVHSREQAALWREKELEERRIAFEKKMEEDEEKLRKAMKSKIQNDMYEKSMAILRNLEKDLLTQQNAMFQKESDIERKERELEIAEREWNAKEIAAKTRLKEKIKQELSSRSTGTQETVRKDLSFIPHVKDETDRKQNSDDTLANIASYHCADDVRRTRQKEDSFGNISYPIADKKEDSFGKRIYPRTEEAEINPPRVIPAAAEQKHSLETEQERKASRGSEVPITRTQIKQEEPGDFIQKPYVGPFSGTQPAPKHENTFEVWKFEVNSLLGMKCYSDVSIVQAIWKSLRGQARNVLFTLGYSAKAVDIVERLESIYGNVVSGEAVLQEFYTAHQEESESVTDWGLRLEQILQRAMEKGHVTHEGKEQKIRDKFWRSLYDQNLKNATKIYHESGMSFEKLQRKVREEECEMQESLARHQQPVQKDRKAKAQHNPQLTDMDDQLQLLKSISENMTRMDRDIQQLKRGQNRYEYRPRRRGGRGRGNRGRGNQNYSEDQYDSNEERNDRSENKKQTENTERRDRSDNSKQKNEKKGQLN